MSNLNNTAVTTSAAFVPAFLNVEKKPGDKETVKGILFSDFAMREVVKGLRATEKGNRSNVVYHTVQVIETVARLLREGKVTGKDFIGVTKDGQPVPEGVKRALNDTMREVIVAMIKAGDAPFLNCATTVARIKAMPKGSAQQRTLWDYQARKLADATLFLNGQAVEKPKGKFMPEALRDAKSKEYVESLKVLRNYTNKLVAYLWHEHNGIFQEFAFRTPDGEAFRDLDATDLQSVADVIDAKAPGGMSDLAHAFRKPSAPADTRTPVEKLLESFAKLTHEDRATFLKAANNKHADLVKAAEAAEAAVNKGDGEGADVVDIFADLRDEGSAPAIEVAA